MADKVIIFDTTLRDGEQAPGASLNQKEKLEVARALRDLGVDVIEAGFPVASKGDFEAVKAIAKSIKGPVICGLARAIKEDMDAVYNALRKSENARIHVFLATSKIHREHKFQKTKEEIFDLAIWAVKYAKKYFSDIEFSPEDASRTEREYLFKIIKSAIDAGATTVNIPDTVGYTTPWEYADLIKSIKEKVPNINKAVISAHCHDDLGLATANSLSAIKNGARQVECTINGIGERAGNASLEEVVMALDTRKDIFNNLKTNINKSKIYKTSQLVSKLTGFSIAPNKAIVGANAFRHEAGVHQDAILRKRETYEIIHGEDVGFTQGGLILGKHSGRHALDFKLRQLGYKLSPEELAKAFLKFKKLADTKKEISKADLAVLIGKKR
ncbi:MAG: 2-isopropylmalate synthase [bacterium]|nr:2-isopropylmalate synthase [bacterium]